MLRNSLALLRLVVDLTVFVRLAVSVEVEPANRFRDIETLASEALNALKLSLVLGDSRTHLRKRRVVGCALALFRRSDFRPHRCDGVVRRRPRALFRRLCRTL